jgi:hypothetical protein
MPLRVPLRAAAVALLVGALAGCAPGRDEFPPVCPAPVLPALTGDLSVYRPGSTGEHLTDLMIQGRMMGIGGRCKLASDKHKLDTIVQFEIELTRGPALQSHVVGVPVYLAVTEGPTILDKRVFLLRGNFPPNVDTITITTGELEMLLPISPTKSGAAYSVLAGFQLTPEQAAAAEAKAAH